ncbi:MAG: STAS domain-containing protein [Ruminiclostridium sp.]|nr:STAS domain-containing protein [Ruminiclostridium sp.]
MTSELIVREELYTDYVKVTLIGEIDIYTAQTLKDKLYGIVESNRMDLRIDCSGLNYIDSTGLGIFVGVLKKTRLYEKNIYMDKLKDNIRKLFVITGLDKLFIIE